MTNLATTAYVVLATRFREIREMDRERGLSTTEVAVLTFILVTVAFGVGAILYRYALEQAENLEELPQDFQPAGADTGS